MNYGPQVKNFWVFFKKFSEDMTPFFGTLVPLFWTSGDVSSGFRSQSGQPYSHFTEAYMCNIPWDSPLVQHLPTSWQPAWQPSHLFHIWARYWWNSKPEAIMPLTVWDQAGQTLYRLSYPGSAEFAISRKARSFFQTNRQFHSRIPTRDVRNGISIRVFS